MTSVASSSESNAGPVLSWVWGVIRLIGPGVKHCTPADRRVGQSYANVCTNGTIPSQWLSEIVPLPKHVQKQQLAREALPAPSIATILHRPGAMDSIQKLVE